MRKVIILTAIYLFSSLNYAASYKGELIAEGRNITIDFKDMELLDVIRVIARKFNINLIAGDNVKGNVTVSFNEVPVDDALESILKVNQYTYVKEGNIIRVIPIEEAEKIYGIKQDVPKSKKVYKVYRLKNAKASELKERIKTILKSDDKIIDDEATNKIMLWIEDEEIEIVDSVIAEIDAEKKPENQEEVRLPEDKEEVEIVKIKYIEPQKLKDLLADMGIQFQGEIKVNETLSSFVIKGTRKNINKIKDTIMKLDTAPLQVVIEAKIVELTDEKGSNTGINWKYVSPNKNSGNNFEIGIGNKDVAGGALDGLDLKVGMLDIDNFELYYNNLMNKSNSNLLSNPTITTLDGKKAEINIGEKLRYRLNTTTTNTTTDVKNTETDMTEIETGITLEVTPTIYEDGKIKMELTQNIEDITGYTADNLPRTSTRKATTNVIVKDYETLVIGGLMKENITEGVTAVPILGDIPILGELFKNKVKNKTKTNLLIFITPKIIKTREFFEGIDFTEKSVDFKIVEENKMNNINFLRRKELIKIYVDAGVYDKAKKEIESLKEAGYTDGEIEKIYKKITGGK